MKLQAFVILSVAILSTGELIAQTNDPTTETTNIIRKCAPNENLRATIQGEVGGFIAKKLAGVSGSGSVDFFEDNTLLEKLIEARPQDAVLIYQMYLNCVKPEISEYLEGRVTQGPKEIHPGDSFSATPGTTVDLFDGEYLFSVNKAWYLKDRKTIFRVTTVLTGGGSRKTATLRQGEQTSIHSKACSIVLSGIDSVTKTFRFTLQCR